MAPGNFLFLHFVGDEAAVAVFESDFFDGVASEEARERNQIGNGEVFDFRTVIQTKNWVATGAEGKEYDSTGPYIDC